MTNEEIRGVIEKQYGDAGLEFSELSGALIVRAPREKIVEFATFCRDEPRLQFNFMSDVTAVDLMNLDIEPRFDVVYNLINVGEYYHRLRIKCGVPEDDCSIDTVSGVWPAAEKPECEIWDLYGISFNNHPNLYRLLMHEDWEGHPLRKDFPLGGSTSFYYKRDTHEYAGEPAGMVPRIRVQKGDV